jgi:hypothetical protein
LEGVADEVFDRILNAYPKGAHTIDSFGYFPIHYASANPNKITKEAALIALDESRVCTQVYDVAKQHSMNPQVPLTKSIQQMKAPSFGQRLNFSRLS